MANDSYTQQALGADPNFQLRVRSALATVAWGVLDEPPATPHHDERAAYARNVIANLTHQAAQVAPWLVHRPNVFSFETSYHFPAAAVVSAAGDADLQSQLITDWNTLAGVADA